MLRDFFLLIYILAEVQHVAGAFLADIYTSRGSACCGMFSS